MSAAWKFVPGTFGTFGKSDICQSFHTPQDANQRMRTRKWRKILFNSSPPSLPLCGRHLGLPSTELHSLALWTLHSLHGNAYLPLFLLPKGQALMLDSWAPTDLSPIFIHFSLLHVPNWDRFRNMERSVPPTHSTFEYARRQMPEDMGGVRSYRNCQIPSLSLTTTKSKLLCNTPHPSKVVYMLFLSLSFFFISLISKVSRHHLIWCENTISEKPDCQQSPLGIHSSQSAHDLW